MKNFIKAASSVAATAVMLLGAPALAQANTAPATTVLSSCDGVDTTQGSGACVENSTASAYDYSSSSSIAKFTTKGKLLVSDMNKVFTKTQQHNARCKIVSGGWNGLSSTDPNNVAKVRWPYKTKICRDAKSPSGWIKVWSWDNTGWTKHCGNWFWPHKPSGPVYKPSQVKYVGHSFSKWMLKGSAKAHSHSHSGVKVKAWCNAPGSHAEAGASATSNGYSAASTAFKAMGLNRVRQVARGTRIQLLRQQKFNAAANGFAKATTQATSDAWARAQCTGTPPPPPSYTAPSVSASAEACVAIGGNSGVVDVTGNNPNDVAGPGTFTLAGASHNAGTVAANSSASTQFTGLAPGTYSGTFSLGEPINKSVSYTVTVNQCDTPVAPAPDVTLDTMNQVIETKSATTGLAVQVYGGDTATVTIATLWGQITTTKTFNNVSGSWNTTIGYTAPGEIPDGSQSFPDTPPPPAGYDQVHVVVVDNQTGKKVVAYTNVKITPLIPAP